MPRRAPLAARCVAVAASRAACVAARAAGWRVVGLAGDTDESLDDAADVCFDELEDEYEAVTFDDLWTPGSYWINPPQPRTLDGRHADPDTGAPVAYDAAGNARPASDAPAADADLSAAERAVLDALDMGGGAA